MIEAYKGNDQINFLYQSAVPTNTAKISGIQERVILDS